MSNYQFAVSTSEMYSKAFQSVRREHPAQAGFVSMGRGDRARSARIAPHYGLIAPEQLQSRRESRFHGVGLRCVRNRPSKLRPAATPSYATLCGSSLRHRLTAWGGE